MIFVIYRASSKFFIISQSKINDDESKIFHAHYSVLFPVQRSHVGTKEGKERCKAGTG